MGKRRKRGAIDSSDPSFPTYRPRCIMASQMYRPYPLLPPLSFRLEPRSRCVATGS